MKRIYDKLRIKRCLEQTQYGPVMKSLQEELFLAQYQKGEFVTSPMQKEPLFQIVVRGSLSIYFVRDDGSLYSLSSGQKDYLIGEMELFSCQIGSVCTEAREELTCLALSIKENREKLLKNCLFLQLVCESLAKKMQSLTTIDAAPSSLKQRVLTYMRYRCGSELRGVQQAAFHLNCSARQLQRILNQYEAEGVVVKTGKGAYRLVCAPGPSRS